MFRDDLHRIHHDELVRICQFLGHDPNEVYSVRITHRRVVVAKNDEFGQLVTIEHKVVQ